MADVSSQIVESFLQMPYLTLVSWNYVCFNEYVKQIPVKSDSLSRDSHVISTTMLIVIQSIDTSRASVDLIGGKRENNVTQVRKLFRRPRSETIIYIALSLYASNSLLRWVLLIHLTNQNIHVELMRFIGLINSYLSIATTLYFIIESHLFLSNS